MDPIDKDFDEKILAKNREIVSQYTINIRGNEKSGFRGEVEEIHTIIMFGKTIEECYAKLIEGTVIVISVMEELGFLIPVPKNI